MQGYTLRWYSGYKKLGQAFIHKDSGLMVFKYQGMPDGDVSLNYQIYIPAAKLRIIEKAATINRSKESTPSTQGNASGGKII